MTTALALATVQGQVHRFTGVIDRFGSFESAQGTVMTVCVRNLRLVQNRREVRPDHWWFRYRQEWAELSLQPGDEVCFTAKIKRQSKGYQDQGNNVVKFQKKPIRTAFGPGDEIRDLAVLKRKKYIDPPTAEVQRLEVMLEQVTEEKDHYMAMVNSFGVQVSELQKLLLEKHQQSVLQLASLSNSHQAKLESLNTQLQKFSATNQGLVMTVGQLEKRLEGSIPKRRSLTMLSVSAVISLAIGVGIGGVAARSGGQR
ncbi:MAG: hypothetical protein MH252_05895 [Thermosynechococcaceae cyanobacterium MS004]|nr:hypothetical protein [Thermosynechococcaceae cyanobacterium MS004]